MKPIKLTMRAFGPYKNEEVIDFTKLKDHRLFVISGATGAGKTTIFDGICFALYGFGSGQDRKDTKILRSDFADDNVHTAVELIFEIRGKRYRVLRQLPHIKEGRKTATGEKYELFEILENGKEEPAVERQKVTDINQKLEEIIGLTYEQFSQIVMLPQGEFRKLLTSQSDNKEEILRKIFKTNRYGEMSLKLEEKKRQAEQKLNEAKAMKNSYIGQISGALPKRESLLFTVLNQNSNIYQIQDALQEEFQYYQQKMVEDEQFYKEAFEKHQVKYEQFIANKSLNERIDAYEEKTQKLHETEQQKPYFEQIKAEYEAAIRASQIEPLYVHGKALQTEKVEQQEKLTLVTEQLEKAKSDFHFAQEIVEKEKAKQNQRDDALQKVRELQKLIPLYEQIEKQTVIVQKVSQEAKIAQSSLELIDNQLTERKQHINQLKAIIEKLEKETEKLNDLLEKQMYLREVMNTFKKYDDLQKRVNVLNGQVVQATNEYQLVKEAYEKEETKWLNNQAAILAANLVPGTPCPVCGSTEHALSHREQTELVDQEILKKMKAKLSKYEQTKFAVEATLNAVNQQANQCLEELENLKASINEQEQFNLKFNEVNMMVSRLLSDQEQLKQRKNELKQLQNENEQLELKRRQLEQITREKKEQYLQQNTILEQHRLSIPIHLQSLEELQKSLSQAEIQRRTLEKAWENAQEQYQNTQTNIATNEEAFKHTSALVEHIEEKLKQTREEFTITLKNAGFEEVQQFIAAKRPESEQKRLQQQYVQFTNELHTLTTQVLEEREQLQGKERIDLFFAEEQLGELKEAYERALQTFNFSKDCERNCIDFSEKLDRIADEIYQLEEVSNQIVDLYNLLRGQNGKKISFERYVQMGYLEQITAAANIRLKNLSNGQYYLECSDRLEAHGRQSGLSLDVYDAYTGQSRDVKTLSGGEKFNASLCLALGMADVIQSFQGSVEIDTMFIDEGFGSLDEESLMKAIDTLIDIQKTGRMIGVISHVAELKAAMPAILEVEKLKEGYSRTAIVLK